LKKIFFATNVTVNRNGHDSTIVLPENLIGTLVEKKRSGVPLFTQRFPVIVDLVPDTSAAKKAGLQQYDKIVGIDSVATPYLDLYTRTMATRKGDSITLKIERNNLPVVLNAKVSPEGKLGFISFQTPDDLDSLGLIKMTSRKYGFLESFPAGVRLAGESLNFYIDNFKKVLSPKTGAYKGLGGFKAMASIFPKSGWDWQSFWGITAFFSIILAFMNLLPIPALDGGHVLFTLIEMISGRKPSDKFLEYAQIVGMVLLFGLMIYANGNDWFGWGRSR